MANILPLSQASILLLQFSGWLQSLVKAEDPWLEGLYRLKWQQEALSVNKVPNACPTPLCERL